MARFSKNEIILVRYPFSDLTSAKIRPAIVVGALARSPDYFVVPLTSRLKLSTKGEFVLTDLNSTGLHVASAVKRGVYTIHATLILKSLGHLSEQDARQLEQSLRLWFDIQ